MMKMTRSRSVSMIGILVLALGAVALADGRPAAQVRFGVIGGTTVSDLDGSTVDSVKTNIDSRNDLAVGGVIDMDLTSRLGLVLEPMYAKRSIGQEFEYFGMAVPSELDFTYIDFPVLLKYSLDLPLVKPYAVGGGTISYLLDAKETFSTDLGRELFGGESIDVKDDASEVDFAWTAGGGITVPLGPVGLFAEGRYERGLINIFDSGESDIHHEGYRILGGVTFGINSGGDETMETTEPPTAYYETAEACNAHKCVGHRLLIVIGNNRVENGQPVDPTIHATADWARQLANVQHKVFFFKRGGESIRLTRPMVPGVEEREIKIPGSRRTRTETQPGWVRYTYEEQKGKKVKTRTGDSEDYGRVALQDCCFLEEVIILAHGSQGSSHVCKRILDMLPELTGGRRIRKLTLWLCSTSNFLQPDAIGTYRSYYGKFCELMAPRPCPCGCDPALCRNVCEDPDGNHPAGYHCPGAGDPGTIYMAAWHQQDRNGEMKYHASKLYIDPGSTANLLATPNGDMRAITVSSPEEGKWSAGTQIVHGADVFGGIRVGTQADFENDYRKSSTVIVDVEARKKTVSGKIPKPPRYEGPRRCAGGEGCIPVAGEL